MFGYRAQPNAHGVFAIVVLNANRYGIYDLIAITNRGMYYLPDSDVPIVTEATAEQDAYYWAQEFDSTMEFYRKYVKDEFECDAEEI